MSGLSKTLFCLAIASLVAGCRLAVIVVEGGEVQSIGSGTCLGGTICVVEVNDTNLSEFFAAVPETGWYFEKWNSGDRFFCAESTDPVCTLSLEGAAGNAAIEEAVASSETFYLMPIFKLDKDIIRVDGKQWLQVDLFRNLSWEDINAVCPSGACVDNGKLNGYDMTGWTWASVEDVNALFNHYLGGNILGPGPGNSYGEPPNPSWASDFFSDGWRATSEGLVALHLGLYSRRTQGWVRDIYPGICIPDCHYLPELRDDSERGFDMYDLATTRRMGSSNGAPPEGAWFYRTL